MCRSVKLSHLLLCSVICFTVPRIVHVVWTVPRIVHVVWTVPRIVHVVWTVPRIVHVVCYICMNTHSPPSHILANNMFPDIYLTFSPELLDHRKAHT